MQRVQIGRGIAALLVVMYHANLYFPSVAGGVMLAGFSGVDFFFILSGVLISLIHGDDLGRADRLLIYIKKRFQRIFPVYWIYTAIVILLHLYIFSISGKILIYWTSMDSLSILSSILLWPTDLSAGSWPIIAVAWTLSYEVVFYSLFAVAIAGGRLVAITGVCIWIALILVAAAGAFGQVLPQPFATLLGLHNLEFIAGCTIGLHLSKRGRRFANAKLTGALGSAILLISWWNAISGYPLMARLDAIQFGIPYVLIIYSLATSDISSPLKKNVVVSALAALGNASYSVYLVHAVPMFLWAIVASDKGVGPQVIVFGAVLIGISSGIAAYMIIERPVLEWLRKLSRQQ